MGLETLVWLLTVAQPLLFLSVTDALEIAGTQRLSFEPSEIADQAPAMAPTFKRRAM